MNKEKLNLSNCTIQELRAKNIKVKVNHSRKVMYVDPTSNSFRNEIIPTYEIHKLKTGHVPYTINPRGGKTSILVTHNGKDYLGETVCSADDNFCRKRSHAICLDRLTEV